MVIQILSDLVLYSEETKQYLELFVPQFKQMLKENKSYELTTALTDFIGLASEKGCEGFSLNIIEELFNRSQDSKDKIAIN